MEANMRMISNSAKGLPRVLNSMISAVAPLISCTFKFFPRYTNDSSDILQELNICKSLSQFYGETACFVRVNWTWCFYICKKFHFTWLHRCAILGNNHSNAALWHAIIIELFFKLDRTRRVLKNSANSPSTFTLLTENHFGRWNKGRWNKFLANCLVSSH